MSGPTSDELRAYLRKVGGATAAQASEHFGVSVHSKLAHLLRRPGVTRTGEPRAYVYHATYQAPFVIPPSNSRDLPPPPVVPTQTVEEFLAQGGRIEKLDIGDVARPFKRIGK